MKNSIFIILCILGLLVQSTIANEETNEYEEEYAENDENQATDDIEFPIGVSHLNSSNSTNATTVPIELLNQNIADSFKTWLDAKSDELHELNMNYSGFKLLNETYNLKLRQYAEFRWINFTEMILNISETIGAVLHNKTLLVKELSEQVERDFDKYQNDSEQIQDSLDFVYYDAKSPYTFCDMKDTKVSEIGGIRSKRSSKGLEPTEFYYEDDNYETLSNNEDSQTEEEDNELFEEETIERNVRSADEVNKKRSRLRIKKTSTAAPTTTTPPELDYYEYDSEEEEVKEDPFMAGEFWPVSECLNRTFDENFKLIRTKMNVNHSTIHIPVNVFKQSMEINMTAYWSEKMNTQFIENYRTDPTLSWQYFCSSTGLFRQYPAAYWTAPRLEDFFDCRLQSWYIMAAASSKDVVILLDTSGSMTGLRLEIATKLVESILDTFTDNDFFNVITFASKSQYLFEDTDPAYSHQLIQASRINKLKFKEALQKLNTTGQGKLTEPLTTSFELLNKSSEERSTANCNQVIMIITDNVADNVQPIFEKYNQNKHVRVFSYKIGRDMSDDPKTIKDLACSNNGEFYHVVTLTDINEHVYEYIPVLSRPMALNALHETTWSNVFLGYLDKDLKIAVARPAFVSNRKFIETLKKQQLYDTLEHLRTLHPLNSSYFENFTNETLTNFISNELYSELQQFHAEENLEYEFDSRETAESKNEKILKQARKINKEQLLLGVVGLDVSVLKLISTVSPKFKMGVGIYIIMIDNNGFIVYHPSIKQQISLDSDSKGTSQSIDLSIFEIPINNADEFENFEHEMIDEKTNMKTLENWKRQGSRVVRRKTEYVYTSILNTPFAVSIASPNSFGRFYIDLPSDTNDHFSDQIDKIRTNPDNQFGTKIQVYNCSYEFNRLSDKIANPEKFRADFCINYLLTDEDQVLALKSDLVLHDTFYKKFNFTIFVKYPNLVKSSFYGTYSGATFYLPVTLFRPITSPKGSDQTKKLADKPYKSNDEIEIDYFDTEKYETYQKSDNLFSMSDNLKHTYSFEKNYYTRAVEFSDYLRTSINYTDPISIYILNETTSAFKDANNETISVTMPLWIDKVPASVAGVVYNAPSFRERIFGTPKDCQDDSCKNICSRRADLNVTCYLVDESGIIVLDNDDYAKKDNDVIGQLLYKVNPWLMLQLEKDGLYDLIITGNKLQECSKPPVLFSSAGELFNFVGLVMRMAGLAMVQLFQTVTYGLAQLILTTTSQLINAADTSQLDSAPNLPKINQNEWRIRNSHCFYFGIYSFNITRWQTMDSNELKTWCNKSDGLEPKKYLAGYLKHSNLILLVVEDEEEVSQCGNIEEMSKNRPENWAARSKLVKPVEKAEKGKKAKTPTTIAPKNDSSFPVYDTHSINRYRNDPLSYGGRKDYCHNYFANESMIFKCSDNAATTVVSSPSRLAYFLSILAVCVMMC